MIDRKFHCEDGRLGHAVYDFDERHRYYLSRISAISQFVHPRYAQVPLFVMLNPSTATERVLDPTLRRCDGFAWRLGYAGFAVVNLFSLRSTDPRALRKHNDPDGGYNNEFTIYEAAASAPIVICAWGTLGVYRKRNQRVLEILRDFSDRLFCLGLTKDGHPKHPLYLRSSAELVPFGRA